jgi:hypothetical protein
MKMFLQIMKWVAYLLAGLSLLGFLSLLMYRVYLEKSTRIETPMGGGEPGVSHRRLSLRDAGEDHDEAFDYSHAPVMRVAKEHMRIPCNKALELEAIPTEEAIIRAVRTIVS